MTTPSVIWDAATNTSTCILVDDKGRKFIGTAKCHPDDLDFSNELTGGVIASQRAMLKYLQSIKRDILQPELNALKQLYYSMNQSKKFNPHSYENIMLQRQIRLKEEDLATIKEELVRLKQDLKLFIATKDATYKKLRENRAKRNTRDENQ